MKKVLLIFVAIIISLSIKAQLDLEQTYHFSGTMTEIAENEFKYFVMDVPLKQCRIYPLAASRLIRVQDDVLPVMSVII